VSALYDTIGTTYARYRRPDPRVQAAIAQAIGDARTIVNVGAGSGSYEPTHRAVVAVEPSRTMIVQRPPGSAPVVQASAETLPFRDGAFDASLALLTTHHWPDARAGLAEMARVSHRQVIFTHDRDSFDKFWLVTDYVPEIPVLIDIERFLTPIEETLDITDVIDVPVPADCTDGFLCAYWRRPEMYLDPDARHAISGLAILGEAIAPAMQRLAADIASGAWDARYGHLRALDELDLGYRIVIANGLRQSER
jgi:SAM-dependent methyltransferase